MSMKFDDSVLVVMATAPAGLGHIRVMEALRQGLSRSARIATLGIDNPSMQWIHRLTSRNVTLKQIMEFTQENSVVEGIFAKNYSQWLMSHTKHTEKLLIDLVATAWPQPETVVVVATHFGLAYELTAAKKRLAKKLGVRIVVAMIVTDDSPQALWAVNGADVIFVPSNTTREKLLVHLYANNPHVIPEVNTIPYPVSLEMGEQFSEQEYRERLSQVRGNDLRVMVPVSGAAVQLDYFRDLMKPLLRSGVQFTVASRECAYAQEFLSWCNKQERVSVVCSTQDQEVVQLYEQEYLLSVYGVEITKPSEQAFKALYTPRQRGGAVLLFSPPVGRQEKDNMAFLRRHRLLPSVDDQARLNEWCLRGNRLHLTVSFYERAKHWRGILLPDTGKQAGKFIQGLLEGNILEPMVKFGGFIEGHEEINSSGVREVWRGVNQLLE